ARTKSFHEREALRKVRTNLRFVDVDHQPRSVVITSAKQGEGKSTVAANLATVLADAGESVVLVDADLRRSAVARAFDLSDDVGLPAVPAGTVGLGAALRPTDTSGLQLLDAPPVLPVTDATLLTRSADGAVLVVAAGTTHREELERTVSSLTTVGGKLLGA